MVSITPYFYMDSHLQSTSSPHVTAIILLLSTSSVITLQLSTITNICISAREGIFTIVCTSLTFYWKPMYLFKPLQDTVCDIFTQATAGCCLRYIFKLLRGAVFDIT